MVEGEVGDDGPRRHQALPGAAALSGQGRLAEPGAGVPGGGPEGRQAVLRADAVEGLGAALNACMVGVGRCRPGAEGQPHQRVERGEWGGAGLDGRACAGWMGGQSV